MYVCICVQVYIMYMYVCVAHTYIATYGALWHMPPRILEILRILRLLPD